MDTKTAEQIIAISNECSRITRESIQRIKGNCDEEAFKIYRSHGGKIMGYLYTELIAPTQSEHTELAASDFEPMESVEPPRLQVTEKMQAELVDILEDLYLRIGSMAELVHDNSDQLETAVYRARIHQVLVHVSEALVCVLSANVGPQP
jgi:hypothetical protein